MPEVAYYTIQAKNAEGKLFTRYLDPNTKVFDEKYDSRRHGMVSEHSAKQLAEKISQDKRIVIKIMGRGPSGIPINEMLIGTEFDNDRDDVKSFFEMENRENYGFEETPLRHREEPEIKTKKLVSE